LRPGVDIPPGLTLQNRPDWKTTYSGVDINFQKRLTNKWMVRGAFTYQDWKQKGGPDSCYDPTSNRGGNALVWPGTAIPLANGSSCAGDDIVRPRRYGSKTEVFLNSALAVQRRRPYQPARIRDRGQRVRREGIRISTLCA
jgi:hypothetical protein